MLHQLLWFWSPSANPHTSREHKGNRRSQKQISNSIIFVILHKLTVPLHRFNKAWVYLQQDKAASLHLVWTPHPLHYSCHLVPSCSCSRNRENRPQLDTWGCSHQTQQMTAMAVLSIAVINQREQRLVCILGNSQVITINGNNKRWGLLFG